jgi:hypothetical protein
MDQKKYPRKMGGDRLERRGEQLVVCSKTDMEEWQVQHTRKTLIWINDVAWRLAGKQQTSTGEVHYLLELWPEGTNEIPGRRIRYDEEYARIRDEAIRKSRLESGVGRIIYHARALIGFLPSRVKSKIELNFGVSSRNASRASILLEMLLFFASGAYLQIFAYAAMRVPELVYFIPCFIVLTPALFVDLVMRYHSFLREDASPWGLFEWMSPRRLLGKGP